MNERRNFEVGSRPLDHRFWAKLVGRWGPANIDQNASLGSRASNGSFRRNLSLAPLALENDSVLAMIGMNGGIRPG